MTDDNRQVVRPEAEPALDRFKWEVAAELGLDEKIKNKGWENMTTREVGKIGGQMTKRMIGFAEEHMADESKR